MYRLVELVLILTVLRKRKPRAREQQGSISGALLKKSSSAGFICCLTGIHQVANTNASLGLWVSGRIPPDPAKTNICRCLISKAIQIDEGSLGVCFTNWPAKLEIKDPITGLYPYASFYCTVFLGSFEFYLNCWGTDWRIHRGIKGTLM